MLRAASPTAMQLRARSISRFSPLTEDVVAAPAGGCRARHLQRLPGALRGAPAAGSAGPQSRPERSVCRDQRLRIEGTAALLDVGVRGGPGDRRTPEERRGLLRGGPATLDELEGEGRVVARYVGPTPNGSLRDVAGISNARGNVVGLMPHPEHAVEEGFGPSTDGSASSPSSRPSRHRTARPARGWRPSTTCAGSAWACPAAPSTWSTTG